MEEEPIALAFVCDDCGYPVTGVTVFLNGKARCMTCHNRALMPDDDEEE